MSVVPLHIQLRIERKLGSKTAGFPRYAWIDKDNVSVRHGNLDVVYSVSKDEITEDRKSTIKPIERKMVRCPVCNVVFKKKVPRQKYCSGTCRTKASMKNEEAKDQNH